MRVDNDGNILSPWFVVYGRGKQQGAEQACCQQAVFFIETPSPVMETRPPVNSGGTQETMP